jgi:hypothetical protein
MALSRSSPPIRGALHGRHETLGAGCDGRGSPRRNGLIPERDQGPPPDERLPRTAKSCGPGAATLAPIPAGLCWRGNGDNKGRSPGRARINRKTIARGRPGCPGCTCQTRVHTTHRSAHGAAGAVGARPSLRPLHGRGPPRWHNPGESAPRECWRLLSRCLTFRSENEGGPCCSARRSYRPGAAGGTVSINLPENTTGPVGAPVGEPPCGSTLTAKVAWLTISLS